MQETANLYLNPRNSLQTHAFGILRQFVEGRRSFDFLQTRAKSKMAQTWCPIGLCVIILSYCFFWMPSQTVQSIPREPDNWIVPADHLGVSSLNCESLLHCVMRAFLTSWLNILLLMLVSLRPYRARLSRRSPKVIFNCYIEKRAAKDGFRLLQWGLFSFQARLFELTELGLTTSLAQTPMCGAD